MCFNLNSSTNASTIKKLQEVHVYSMAKQRALNKWKYEACFLTKFIAGKCILSLDLSKKKYSVVSTITIQPTAGNMSNYH